MNTFDRLLTLKKNQNYVAPWVALNNKDYFTIMFYYCAGVLVIILLGFLYSTYGNYCAACMHKGSGRVNSGRVNSVP